MAKIRVEGHKFGKLFVVNYQYTRNGRDFYKCKCDCGAETIAMGKYLKNGDIKSCGCLKIETAIENSRKGVTHGMTKHPLYKVWSCMKDRCLNERSHAYKLYGGRGVQVCERWLVFSNFVEDVIQTYSDGLQLDRFPDKNGNYSPDNFRWATCTENIRNRRTTVFLEVNGVSKPIGQWAQETGISRHSIWHRVRKGDLGEVALFGTRKNKKIAA